MTKVEAPDHEVVQWTWVCEHVLEACEVVDLLHAWIVAMDRLRFAHRLRGIRTRARRLRRSVGSGARTVARYVLVGDVCVVW
jgi:hypothetical protein